MSSGSTIEQDRAEVAGSRGLVLPTFLIVGAMKAATDTLREVLRGHPEVFVAPGEPMFFLAEDAAERMADYAHTFEGVTVERAIGEKSPGYCYAPAVAERIRAVLPEVRIVFMLREPVARAYSNYWHRVLQGAEPLEFAQAVARERAGERDRFWQLYLKRSLYAEQPERFLAVFPRATGSRSRGRIARLVCAPQRPPRSIDRTRPRSMAQALKPGPAALGSGRRGAPEGSRAPRRLGDRLRTPAPGGSYRAAPNL
jgi:hypothetical protein